MTKRFDGLTKAQEDALFSIAFAMTERQARGGGASRKTIAALLERGLIEETGSITSGWPPLVYRYYSMPIPQHMRLCQWCSENVEDPP